MSIKNIIHGCQKNKKNMGNILVIKTYTELKLDFLTAPLGEAKLLFMETAIAR